MNNIWCEVNKTQLLDNIKIIKDNIKNKKLIAVLKADAYGLDIKNISSIIDNTVDMYAVSSKNEYEKISSNKDVLIMSPLCSLNDFEYAKNKKNLILTIDNKDILDKLDKESNYRIHLCVDTTNHRIGLRINEIQEVIENIERNYKNIKIEGMYTHFHNCSNIEETKAQINDFKQLVENYKNKSYFIHCIASSIATNKNLLNLCDFSNACRIGNLIYGFSGQSLGTKKVFEFKARILQKYNVLKGELIGFGASYHRAKKDMVVGIIEAGHFYNLGCVRETVENPAKTFLKAVKYNLKGINYISSEDKSKNINIVGNINMNSTVLDITNCKDETVVTLNVSTILGDSSIEKVIK